MAILIETSSKTKEITRVKDISLSTLIRKAGFSLDMKCAGMGICGKCAVNLKSGVFLVEGKEIRLKERENFRALSCKTKVLSEDAHVRIPDEAVLEENGKIHNDFSERPYNFSPVVRKLNVEIPEASLKKPLSVTGRIAIEVERQSGLKIADPNLNIVAKLSKITKKSYKISLTVGMFRGIWNILDASLENLVSKLLGLAVDIGTTTVAVMLVDMENGEILAKETSYNQQMKLADDIASRISAASASHEDLEHMRELVVENTVNKLVKKLCAKTGNNHRDIYVAALSGNTVMTHLFSGISPFSIGTFPFAPATNRYPDRKGGKMKILMNEEGTVRLFPSVAGYVGGDVVSDIFISSLKDNKGLCAMIDIGTNSEMVLADNEQLTATAAAAGPAFEGAGIMCGCRAVHGAVEHISFDRELNFNIETIDGGKPVGLCGTATIDFIAEGFRCGLINEFGRIDTVLLKEKNRYYELEYSGRKVSACMITPASESGNSRDIFITETDIEQILKAKGAVYSGLKTLLSKNGRTFSELDRIILAGGFAGYIKIDNAVYIGMLPDLDRKKYGNIGNASLGGAYYSLVDSSVNAELDEIAGIPEVTALNTIPEFENNYIDALLIPNFSAGEFPHHS